MGITAEIESFNPENGFGFLRLTDGRHMLFDVTACLSGPWPGQAVRVELAEDGARVLRVEPTSVPDSSHPVTTLTEAVRRLRAEGLLSELSQGNVGGIVERLGLAGLPEDVAAVFGIYYAHPVLGAERARNDGFLRFGGGSVVPRLEALLDEPAPSDPDLDAAPPSLRGGELPLEDAGFVASACQQSKASVADLLLLDQCNAGFEANGDARRVVVLREGTGAFCLGIRRARRMAEVGALPVDLSRPHLSPVAAK